MTCQRCGTALERGRVLCPNCKEPVRAAIALAASQTAAAAHDEAVSQPRTMQMPAVKIPIAGVPVTEPPPTDAPPTEAPPTESEPQKAPKPSGRPPDRPLRAGEIVAGAYTVLAAAGTARFGMHYQVREDANGAPLSLWTNRADEAGIARAM